MPALGTLLDERDWTILAISWPAVSVVRLRIWKVLEMMPSPLRLAGASERLLRPRPNLRRTLVWLSLSPCGLRLDPVLVLNRPHGELELELGPEPGLWLLSVLDVLYAAFSTPDLEVKVREEAWRCSRGHDAHAGAL